MLESVGKNGEIIYALSIPEGASDAEIINIVGGDADDDFGLILHLHEHLDLGVRLKAGENSRCMIIVEKLSAEFKIQLAAKGGNTLAYML